MTDSPRELKYGRHEVANQAETLAFPGSGLGQRNPQHCPPPDQGSLPEAADPLGPPMTIREAAAMLGCSCWTVRQRYLPLGLPHFRIGKSGKLTFYRNQLVRWVLRQQQLKKGGRP
jgi:hypothetical protein